MAHTVRSALRRLFFLVVACASCTLAWAQAPATNPNITLSKAGKAQAIALQADGKIIVGGDFNRAGTAARTGLARLNADGSVDPSWTVDVAGVVEALKLNGNDLYVGGNFTSVGGVPRNGVAKIDISTQAVAAWNPNVGGTVNALDLAGSELVIAGAFFTVAGQPRMNLAKIDSAGSPVPGWAPNPNSYVDAMVVTTNHVFVAAPFMTTISGAPRTRLAKIDIVTAAATNWAPNPDSSVLSLATNSGSAWIYAAGYFSNIDGQARFGVAKLTRADGAPGTLLDTTFNAAPDAGIESVDVSNGDDVFVASPYMTMVGGATRYEVAKVSGTTGAALAWTPFTGHVAHQVNRDLFYPYRADRIAARMGNLYYMSDFVEPEGLAATGLLRTTSGVIDASFTPRLLAPGDVFAIARQPDGKVLVAGSFHLLNFSTPRRNLLRLNTDGTVDDTLNLDIDGAVRALAVDTGALYIGGVFGRVGPSFLKGIAKIAYDGTVMSTLGNFTNGGVRSIAIDPATSAMYVSGSFNFVGNPGLARIGLAKLDRNTGVADSAFDASMGYFEDIYAMAFDSGALYVAGSFFNAGGLPRQRVAKLNGVTGAADPAFNADANNLVDSLLVANGSLYAAGRFTAIAGAPRQSVARLDLANGTQNPAWQQNSSGSVTSLAYDGNHIYVGLGWSSSLTSNTGSVYRYGAARVDPASGMADATWDPQVMRFQGSQPVDVVLHASAAAPNAIAGGTFTHVKGVARGSLAAVPKVPPPQASVYAAAANGFSLYFGYQSTGTTGTARDVRITNYGSVAAEVSGFDMPAWMTLTANGCTVIPASSNCTFSVAFAPSVIGRHNGTITISGNFPNQYVNALGFGIAPAQPAIAYSSVLADVLRDSADITFGNQAIGLSRSEEIIVHNVGSAALHVTGFSGVSAPFAGGGTCLGASIPAGGTCTVAASFMPSTMGLITQSLGIVSDASNGPRNVALMGVGEDGTAEGSLDPTFGNLGRRFIVAPGNPITEPMGVAVQPNGRIVMLSWERLPDDILFKSVLRRLMPDGAIDTSFGTAGVVAIDYGPGDFYPMRVRVQPDGKILAVLSLNGDTRVYRFLSDGSADTAFGSGGYATVPSVSATMELMRDGRIVVGGRNGNNALKIARLLADGTPDMTFGASGVTTVSVPESIAGISLETDLDVASDGKIVIGHSFNAGTLDVAVRRLNANGTLDSTFGSAGRATFHMPGPPRNQTFHRLRLQADGKVLLALDGIVNSAFGGAREFVVVRLAANGALDTGFGSGGVVEANIGTGQGSTPLAIELLGQGKILVAGLAGNTREPLLGGDLGLIRLNPNGTFDATFGANGVKVIMLTRWYQNIFDTALAPNGDIVAVGSQLYQELDSGAFTGNSHVVRINNDAVPPRLSQYDFNADGHADVIWSNTANGATYVWHMGGPPPALISDAFMATIDPSWKIQGVADFNGDGHPDVVWRNTANGNCYVWYMIDNMFQSDAFVFSLPPEWVIQGVADFNADSHPDFLMRNVNSGVAFAWFFNDNVAIGDQFLFGIDPSWKVEQVGDLNHDGQPDLLFRNMGSGLAFAWHSSWNGSALSLGSSTPPIFSIDPVWEIVQLDDWNGDGNPDLLFRNASSGVVFVWYMNADATLGAGSDYVIQIDPSWEIVPRR